MQDGIKNRLQDGRLVSFGICIHALARESLPSGPRGTCGSWVPVRPALLLVSVPCFKRCLSSLEENSISTVGASRLL